MEFIDEYFAERDAAAEQFGYGGKVRELMIFLGYRPDPKYPTMEDALMSHWQPKTLDTAMLLKVYGEIDAIIHGLVVSLKKIEENSIRDAALLGSILVDGLQSEYTGKWFRRHKQPKGWLDLEEYSASFIKDEMIFAVPEPIAEMILPLFGK